MSCAPDAYRSIGAEPCAGYAAGKQEEVGGGGRRQKLLRLPRAQTVDLSVSKIGVQPHCAIIGLTGRDLGSQT
jgi:hypothetical protein